MRRLHTISPLTTVLYTATSTSNLQSTPAALLTPSLSLLTRMDVSGRSWLGVSTSALGLLSIPVVTTLSSALGSTVHPVYLVYLLLATASITSSLLLLLLVTLTSELSVRHTATTPSSFTPSVQYTEA